MYIIISCFRVVFSHSFQISQNLTFPHHHNFFFFLKVETPTFQLFLIFLKNSHDMDHHVHGTHSAKGSYEYIPGESTVRVLSVEDDTESCYEFEFQTSNLSQSPPASGESPADKLFNNGRIVPLKRLDGCDHSGEADEYCDQDREVEKMEGEEQVSMKEIDQKLTDIRKKSIVDSTVLNGFIKLKKLMKYRARRLRLRLTFSSSQPNSHNTKVKQETTTTTAARSSFYTKSWSSFFNWLFLRSHSKHNNGEDKHMKPRIVEINGQGPMAEVLDVLTAGRLSTDSRNGLVIESGSRPSSAPASPSHWNCDSRYEERESSVMSAISFCKKSHQPREEKSNNL